MAKKSNPLAAMVRGMVPEPAPKPAAPAPQPAKQTAAPRPLSRQGKTFIAVYVEPDAHKQLKVFAAMNGRGIQDCMLEALDDFFDKQGLNRIAQPQDD